MQQPGESQMTSEAWLMPKHPQCCDPSRHWVTQGLGRVAGSGGGLSDSYLDRPTERTTAALGGGAVLARSGSVYRGLLGPVLSQMSPSTTGHSSED